MNICGNKDNLLLGPPHLKHQLDHELNDSDYKLNFKLVSSFHLSNARLKIWLSWPNCSIYNKTELITAHRSFLSLQSAGEDIIRTHLQARSSLYHSVLIWRCLTCIWLSLSGVLAGSTLGEGWMIGQFTLWNVFEFLAQSTHIWPCREPQPSQATNRPVKYVLINTGPVLQTQYNRYRLSPPPSHHSMMMLRLDVTNIEFLCFLLSAWSRQSRPVRTVLFSQDQALYLSSCWSWSDNSWQSQSCLPWRALMTVAWNMTTEQILPDRFLEVF